HAKWTAVGSPDSNFKTLIGNGERTMLPKPTIYDAQTVFAGNDYLGLARDERLLEALMLGGKLYGVSSTSSRWAIGWTEVHAQLERELARYFGTDDACIL